MRDPTSPDRPLRIFVVENHEDTLKALTEYLISSGHAVHSAHTMNEALHALPSAECDVLIRVIIYLTQDHKGCILLA
jgi:two-component system CheB/CheR fusion protein